MKIWSITIRDILFSHISIFFYFKIFSLFSFELTSGINSISDDSGFAEKRTEV